MKPSSSRADYLRSIDIRSPISSEFRIRTLSGASLSLLTILLAFYLIYSEYNYNLSTSIVDHVHVVDQRSDGLEVSFDITFHHIPCALLAADANDPTGQGQSFHIDSTRHRVYKGRITKDGKAVGRKSKLELGNTIIHEDQVEGVRLAKEEIKKKKDKRNLGEEENDEAVEEKTTDVVEEEEIADNCGSCYGAGEEGECCNTCDDVKRAYHRKSWHIPDLSVIAQCADSVRASDEDGEGCHVHGYVALSTGGGDLHFAPDRNWEREGNKGANGADSSMFNALGFIDLKAIANMFADAYEQFNVSHTINHLSFGQHMSPTQRRVLNLSCQLDGAKRTVTDGYGMFQYYLQVVPTVYKFLNGTVVETFQYSVTEHTRHVDPGSGRGLPGVFFFYEVSALHVEFEEVRRGWTQFFTGVCAAVGGAYTVMSMLDRVVYEWRAGRGGGGSGVGEGSLVM
jgi:hypothetical protein